jgi:hypothetical protein
MTGRPSLLAGAIEVPITAVVLHSGARAVDAAGRPLLAYRHLPSTPPAPDGVGEWEARELGGPPGRLPQRTDHMREGTRP